MAPNVSVDLRVSDERMSGVLVLDTAALTVAPDWGAWTPGPLPLVQPSNRTTRRLGHERITDEETRRTLVAGHQADALYGSGSFDRCHLRVPDGGQLVALESLRERDPVGPEGPVSYLVVHVLAPEAAIAEQHLTWWSDLLRDRHHESELWKEVAELLGGPFEAGARIRHLAFISTDQDDAHALALAYAVVGGLATELSTDVLDRAARHKWTLTKPDWSALVLRDGASYVAHQASEEKFGPTLRMLMHSVHLDALLLALLQRRLIDRSGDRATRVDLEHPEDLVDLEKSHFEFKRKYWRTSITDKRTAPPDVIFRAFQEELLTILDVNDVETRVRDGARLSLSLSARQQEVAQHELTRLVQIATAVLGAFSLCYTAAPVLTTPSPAHFLAATAVAVPLAITIFVFLVLMGRRKADAAGV